MASCLSAEGAPRFVPAHSGLGTIERSSPPSRTGLFNYRSFGPKACLRLKLELESNKRNNLSASYLVLTVDCSICRLAAWLTAPGGVKTKARSHPLLPLTLPIICFLDLGEGVRRVFATQLTHL
jgi:hypothetical protein